MAGQKLMVREILTRIRNLSILLRLVLGYLMLSVSCTLEPFQVTDWIGFIAGIAIGYSAGISVFADVFRTVVIAYCDIYNKKLPNWKILKTEIKVLTNFQEVQEALDQEYYHSRRILENEEWKNILEDYKNYYK